MHRLWQHLGLVFAALAVCLWGAGAKAQEGEAVVLLSFDVEKYFDFDALRDIDVGVPATYFITGELAEMLPERVGELALPGNTIGSHSYLHLDLTQLSDQELREQLGNSRAFLEQLANGKAVVWYRAPFLEEDQRVVQAALGEGYRFTSSSFESKAAPEGIGNLPVSIGAWYLEAVDYVWFTEFEMDEPMVYDYLVNSFERAKKLGRPLVVLMHPSIIGPHKAVLKDFIDYATQHNGVFLSFEGYALRALKSGDGETLGLKSAEPASDPR